MISKIKSILDRKSLSFAIPCLVFLSLLAANASPFGAVQLSFFERFLFWVVVMILAASIAHVSTRIAAQYAVGLKAVMRDVVITVLVTVLFTPSLWLLTWIVSIYHAGVVPNVLTMAQYGMIFATGLLVLRRSFPEHDEAPTPPEVIPPRIYKRLPEGFNAPILRLTVHDHSVDIVTTEGVHTIRSRFVDAIDEMEPVVGYCTHRSHWVTADAIESVERQAGKIFVRLVNGDLVPISRKYRPKLEKAGIV